MGSDARDGAGRVPIVAHAAGLFEPYIRPATVHAMLQVPLGMLHCLRPHTTKARRSWERFVALRISKFEAQAMDPLGQAGCDCARGSALQFAGALPAGQAEYFCGAQWPAPVAAPRGLPVKPAGAQAAHPGVSSGADGASPARIARRSDSGPRCAGRERNVSGNESAGTRTKRFRRYSSFGIGVDRKHTAKWRFHQENATFQCSQKFT